MENVATEEFISRTEALEDFESCNAENPNWTPPRVKTLLLRQPAADVAPVVHGWWKKVRKSRSTWECSACGVKVGAFFVGISQYCYCCGARMGGVAE